MSYKAIMTDGSVIEIANATDSKKDGSGTYFYDSTGKQISSFQDGMCKGAYPADSTVTAAPTSPTPTETPPAS